MDGPASACHFCDLDGFRTESTLVYENDWCLFGNADRGTDGAPAGSGVIVPKAHRPTVFDLTPEEIAATFELLASARPALDERYRPDGYVIGWNCFEAAGQAVPHAHLHVLLRYDDEPLAGKGLRWFFRQPDNRRPEPTRAGHGRAAGALRARTGCRVLLVDRHRRVLLVRSVDDGRVVVPGEPPAPPTYWLVPGGGVELGESFEQAARREVLEETGIADFELGPLLWERRGEALLDGAPLRFIERLYAGFVDAAEATLDRLDPAERGVLVEHRWWRVDEITDPDRADTIFPREIVALAPRAVAARPAG